MTICEAANRINELFSDYDPFNYDESVLTVDDIADMIADRDATIINDLTALANSYGESEDYLHMGKAAALLGEIAKMFYVSDALDRKVFTNSKAAKENYQTRL